MSESQNGMTYWEHRAGLYANDGAGLRAVCSFGMPALYNLGIHLSQRHALGGLVCRLEGQTVLDVGCGVGRWTVLMARTAKCVVGIDISQTMLREAAARANKASAPCCFIHGDIAKVRQQQRFHTILCVTVLQHLTDDQMERALGNMRAMLAAGGRIVLLEVAPTTANPVCDTEVFRTRSFQSYRSALEKVGLQITSHRGVDVVPVKKAVLPLFRKLPRPLVRAMLVAMSTLALPIDLSMARFFPHVSWHRVFVAEARDGDA